MLYAYIYIESLLFVYLVLQMPHIEYEFNVLEIVTSILMMFVFYCMQGFLTTSILTPETQWGLGYLSCGMIILIVVLNAAILVHGIVHKIKLNMKKKKNAKEHEEKMLKLRARTIVHAKTRKLSIARKPTNALEKIDEEPEIVLETERNLITEANNQS